MRNLKIAFVLLVGLFVIGCTLADAPECTQDCTDTQTCIDGTCVEDAPDCSVDPTLCDPATQVCSSGADNADPNGCIPKPTGDACPADGICGDGTICVTATNTCEPTPGTAGEGCDQTTGDCVDGLDCDLTNFVCVDNGVAGCVDGVGSCINGFFCGTTTGDEDCIATAPGDNQSCDFGVDGDSDCSIGIGAGSTCDSSGHCSDAAASGGCTSDTDCSTNELCLNGTCQVPPQCNFTNGDGFCDGGLYCSGELGRCARPTRHDPFCDPQQGSSDCLAIGGPNSTCLTLVATDVTPNKTSFVCSVIVDRGCNTTSGEDYLASALVCGAGQYCSDHGCASTAADGFCEAENDCDAAFGVSSTCSGGSCQ